MCNRAFELIFNDKGYLGLLSKQAIKPASGKGRARQEIVLMAWRSPHATKEQNIWLEKKMQEVYTKYYLKVLVGSLGEFWDGLATQKSCSKTQ